MSPDPTVPLERIELSDDVVQCPWRMWGPYLSDRQWGTVREDYSPAGSAWEDFPHDDARHRAYRWGEDGHKQSEWARTNVGDPNEQAEHKEVDEREYK